MPVLATVAYEHDLRRAERHASDVPCRMLFDRRALPGRVEDISRIGAKLAAPEPPETGTEIVLVVDSFEVVATVVWRTDIGCGLTFHRPLMPGEVNSSGKRRRRTISFPIR